MATFKIGSATYVPTNKSLSLTAETVMRKYNQIVKKASAVVRKPASADSMACIVSLGSILGAIENSGFDFNFLVRVSSLSSLTEILRRWAIRCNVTEFAALE